MATDPQQFEDLLRGHARLMAAAIRRVCGRHHQALAPDIEQEVYLALWKRLGSGNEIAHPTSYLYKMALTTALAMVRKHDPQRVAVAPAPDSVEGADGLLPAERRRLLTEVLAQVAPEEARALRAYLAGFNHSEIAELFGWSESVARHRIYRAIGRLKSRAAAQGKEGNARRALR